MSPPPRRRLSDLPEHHPETRESALEVLVDELRRIAGAEAELREEAERVAAAEQELREEAQRLRREGSDNFRRYRRRSIVAIAVVSIVAAFSCWQAIQTASDVRDGAIIARTDLARAGADVALTGCQADRDTRTGIRTFVAVSAPKLSDRVAAAFPPRDCAAEVAPLLERIGR